MGEMEEDRSDNSVGLEHSSGQGLRLVGSKNLLKRGLHSISALDHILRFPDNNTNCAVFSYDTGSSIVDWFDYMAPPLSRKSEPIYMESHGIIRGPFACPNGKRLVLVLNGAVKPCLEILEKLRRNSITGLLLLGGFCNLDFQYVRHFEGIICLSLQGFDSYNMQGNSVDDESLSNLQGMESLQYLDLTLSAITDSGLAQLSHLRHLTHLNLDETNVTGEFVERMHHLKSTLRHLRISGPMVTDETLNHILRLESLEFLEVCSEHITNIEESFFRQNRTLTELNLRGRNITNVDLSGLESLTTLRLHGTNIGDIELSGLTSLRNLRTLNLTGTNVGDRAMKSVSEIQSLTRLRLEGTQVTEKSINLLSKLKSLKHLDIRFTPLAENGYEVLKERLPNCIVNSEHIFFSHFILGRSQLWQRTSTSAR